MKIAVGFALVVLALASSSEAVVYRYVGTDSGLHTRADAGSWTTQATSGGPNTGVHALEVSPNDCHLFVGGGFTTFDGGATGGGLYLDGTATTALNVNGTVNAINQGNMGQAIFAGDFNKIGTTVAENAAFINVCGANTMLGAGFNGPVRDVLNMGTLTYIGGAFTAVNTALGDTQRFAVYDGVDEALEPLGTGVPPYPFDGTVNAVAAVGMAVFAGGEFRQSSTTTVHGLAEYNGAAWTVPTGWVNVQGTVVAAMAQTSTHVVIAGTLFEDATPTASACGLAVYNVGANTVWFADSSVCSAASIAANGDVTTVTIATSLAGGPYVLVSSGVDGDVKAFTVDAVTGGGSLVYDATETNNWAGANPSTGSAVNAIAVAEDLGDASVCVCPTGGGSPAPITVPSLLLAVGAVVIAVLAM